MVIESPYIVCAKIFNSANKRIGGKCTKPIIESPFSQRRPDWLYKYIYEYSLDLICVYVYDDIL